LKEYDIYVDALLGTGFKGIPKDSILDCIKYLNATNKPVVSIDINSGLNGDTGLCEYAVKSDLTVSIGCFKPGLFLNKAKDYIKKIVNIDIELNLIGKPFFLMENNDVKNFLKPRFNFSNKGTYGYVGIMGGSENYPGAIRLANLGQTALRCGCGVSKLIVPSEIYELIFANVLETTITKIPSQIGKMIFDKTAIDNALKGIKALGIGVGWGESEEYKKILEYILTTFEIPVLIDADGLNTLSQMDLNILNESNCKIILTPHLKEFSRLTNYSISDITNNLIEYGKEFVSQYNVTLLLKGPTTLVFGNDKVYFITTGNSGMATAGSGDVLTGIITGLLGYHYEDITMTVAASAYINGFAGDLAALKYGEISMLSSDTATMIGNAIKELMK
jgi:NAD(P)H-hydrate epimerase